MQQLTRCFKSLETAGYLKTRAGGSLPDIQLLEHGQAYALQLQRKWLNLRNLAVNLGTVEPSKMTATNSRLSFMQSKLLRAHIQQLKAEHPRKAKCPTLFKHQQSLAAGSLSDNNFYTHKTNVTQLITDFLVEPHRSLEHFYNVQRESKIWWMRYSSNPSRYAITPLDLQHLPDYTESCQAIDIKSSFGDGQITVEQLTLMPLPNEPHFILPDARTGKPLLPAVIRSVIELEPATCALLLDGCDHGRDAQTLLLNRILAPYQCSIACLQSEKLLEADMQDLQKHFVYVLQKAGLRLTSDNNIVAHNELQLKDHMQNTDALGIPYTLLLDNQTLQNGMLQLRNRDTKLTETIHISDIPDYLMNIFRN